MFFALDVGNSRLKWAMYEKPDPLAKLVRQGVCFLENIDHLAEGDWAALPRPEHILGCIVTGDGIKTRVKAQLELWDTRAHWVVPSDAEAGLINGYDHPTRLGADRFVAMIGARYRSGKMSLSPSSLPPPIVLAMIGTAVTVEAIDADGKFLGGFILPGHGIMLKALESGTAGLHVPTGEVTCFPTNTSDALTSGGTYAICGAIEQMVVHLTKACGREPLCLMTGGAAWKVNQHMQTKFELIDSLIFDGLLVIAQSRFA